VSARNGGSRLPRHFYTYKESTLKNTILQTKDLKCDIYIHFIVQTKMLKRDKFSS